MICERDGGLVGGTIVAVLLVVVAVAVGGLVRGAEFVFIFVEVATPSVLTALFMLLTLLSLFSESLLE